MRNEKLIKTVLKEATLLELMEEAKTREDMRLTVFLPLYDKCVEQLDGQSLSPQDLYYLAKATSISIGCLKNIVQSKPMDEC